MEKRRLNKTFIKEWREFRGLSLRKLAARIEREPGEELISFASLGRIEKGQQPYSQPILEGLAKALDVSVSQLLESDPHKEGEIIDLLKRLDDAKKEDVVKMLRGLAS